MKYVSQQDLVKVLFTALTGSASIKQEIPDGSVRLYDTEAPPEPNFPYFVHRIALGGGSLEDVVTNGRYYISIYTYGEGSGQLNSLVREVVDEINNKILSSDDVGYLTVTLTEGGGRQDTGNENVKRYDLPFDLKYTL